MQRERTAVPSWALPVSMIAMSQIEAFVTEQTAYIVLRRRSCLGVQQRPHLYSIWSYSATTAACTEAAILSDTLAQDAGECAQRAMQSFDTEKHCIRLSTSLHFTSVNLTTVQ